MGYSIGEVLSKGVGGVLYRAVRSEDGMPVVLKVLPERYSPIQLRHLKNEWEVAGGLDLACVVKPLSLDSWQGLPALVLEDTGGEPLDGILQAPLAIGRFLELAASMAEGMADLHARNIIHKDVKPQNLLVISGSGRIKFADFGIATALPAYRPAGGSVRMIEGSLPYMSPEQTGRTNRFVDHRSDLYSLGVVFYQMLTGRLPFEAEDPLEWVHCHIARIPVPPAEAAGRPAEAAGGIPGMLSDIVMKLLAKDPEERYQGAKGLWEDLEKCREQWEAQGGIEAFPLGLRDVSDRLRLPQKLYGREKEIDALVGAFEHMVASGQPEMLLVSGYSGIGKSSLAQELRKPAVREKGFFVAGKFDQYKRDIPYSTIVDAFKDLVLEILAESDERIALWRERLQAALGVNGQLIIDVIPLVELIVGRQPPVPELPPAEAQNRFRIVFRHFIGEFARREHPLVLFLDDLQWADSASLGFLQDLLIQLESRHLLILGAYRDNEVGPSHPMSLTVDSLRKAKARITTLVMGPLSKGHLAAFLEDALHAPPGRAAPLADLLEEKTGGNPFFALQFLSALHEERLLEFDSEKAEWVWDVAKIRAKGFTDNVADLMAGKVLRLPAASREALRYLACLGAGAETGILAVSQDRSREATHADLSPPVRAGLVFRMGDTYKFLHDRVQEASYSLIPAEERASFHLRIGRRMAQALPKGELRERVFDVVNQLNRGMDLIDDPRERVFLRGLDFLAGRRAKASIAYASARWYFAQAVALLPEDAWRSLYPEAVSLHLELAECEYLRGEFGPSDGIFDLILANARSKMDKAKVYGLRTRLYQIAGKYSEAVDQALEALALFDVRIPLDEAGIDAAMAEEIREVRIGLAGRKVAELVDAPLAATPEVKAVIGLFMDAMPCLYVSRPRLFPIVVLKALNTSLRHGNTEEACFIYSCYSIMLVAGFGDIPLAAEFSELALALNERFRDARLKGTLLFMHGCFVNPWIHPLASSRPILEKAFVASLDVGDLVYATYNCCQSMWLTVERGDILEDVSKLSEKYLAFARESRNDPLIMVIRQYQQWIKALKGSTRDAASFEEAGGFSEAECLDTFEKGGFGTGLFFHHMLKEVSHCLHGRPAEALASAAVAEPLLGTVRGAFFEATFFFYQGLAAAALHDRVREEERPGLAALLKRALGKFSLWAAHGPENCECRKALLEAESARVEGRDLEARRAYDRAIKGAAEAGLVHIEALADELAGRYYDAGGFARIAAMYLRDARAGFLRWGADGKARQLESQYPFLIEGRTVAPTATFALGAGQIDVGSVIKASQAISLEIELDSLLSRLVRILLEQAGAQRGFVMLRKDSGLEIEAEATLEESGSIAVRLLHSVPDETICPLSMVNYVWRTGEVILLDNASESPRYASDPYVGANRPKSALCLPILRQRVSTGIVYLENNLVTGVFTADRVGILEVLASQAAISLENARLYASLRSENEERRRAEERFSKVFHASPVPLSITRVEDGVFLDINESNLKFLGGYARHEVVGHSVVELGIMSRESFGKATEAVIGSGFLTDVEFAITGRSGSRRIALVSCERMELGGEDCVLTASVDITDRKRSEEQLRQSQKMEALGRLAGGIAHDFNNLLTAINGYSGLALQGMSADHPLYLPLVEILRSGERAASLTRQLLTYSRKQLLAPRVWSLNAVVSDLAAMLKRIIGEDVRLELRLGAPEGMIRADRGQVEQILLNLVINARDAMPHGGKVTVETGRAAWTEIPADAHPRPQPGSFVVLSVADTGQGMTAEVLSRIFEPFFTTKDVGKGTGLGLSVVYGIMEQSGGSIWVETEPGKGSTFHIFFPEYAPAGGDAAARGETPRGGTAGTEQPLRPGRESVLLVEDEESVRKYTGSVLESLGFAVLPAENGRAALNILERAQPRPALVITDVVMPEMGGVELAGRIRRDFSGIPILFISGYTEQAAASGNFISSDESFLQKPFTPTELATRIRVALDRGTLSRTARE